MQVSPWATTTAPAASATGPQARLLGTAAERGVAVIANEPFGQGALFRRVRGKAVPAWAVEGEGEVGRMRDDDLRTAWTCELDPYKPCALGMHLGDDAQLQAQLAQQEAQIRDKRAELAQAEANLDRAERMEVMRGPMSAVYGNSAGGVIQLFTRDGKGRPSVEGGFSAGSYGSWKTDLAADGIGTTSSVGRPFLVARYGAHDELLTVNWPLTARN